jgi:maltose alpha-D-glucosyltransferase/alpha-amylase
MTLVLRDGWEGLSSGATRAALEQRLLPGYLMKQRWYKAKSEAPPRVDILQSCPLHDDYRLVLVRATPPGLPPQRYAMLLGIAWEGVQHDPMQQLHASSLCRVRRASRVGVLYESSGDEPCIRHLLSAWERGEPLASRFGGKLHFQWEETLPPLGEEPIRLLNAEQTNSSAAIGEKAVLKLIREPRPGVDIEEEITGFFTHASPFARIPRLLGSVRMEGEGGEMLTVALLKQALRNQGDGWHVTLGYLERLISDTHLLEPEARTAPSEQYGYYLTLAEQLGRRTAEMHRAFHVETGNPDFDPEPTSGSDRDRWLEAAQRLAEDTLQQLERALPSLPDDALDAAEQFLKHRSRLLEALQAAMPAVIRTRRTRVHGDFHLGQVLVDENDFYIIDFEGEPSRPAEERRAKTCALRDVAGMIRSFDYVAATALKRANPPLDQERYELEALLAQWRTAATATFLRGYREESRSADSAETQDALIYFFLLEKALYEILYEIRYRPDWISIPLRGMLRLLGEGAGL